jgi:DNA-binding transcriptional LysR family regulator
VALIQAIAVAEHLSFRHAAVALGVSQSSVSQRIGQLETELGVLLFERRHRGVAVTAAGERFLEQVACGMGHLDHAVKAAGMLADDGSCGFRIGLGGILIPPALAECLGRFRCAFPGIVLAITDGQSGEMLRRVRDRKIDIAFVARHGEVPDCHWRPLWRERPVVALPAHHVLADKRELDWPDMGSQTMLVRHHGVEALLMNQVLHRFRRQIRQPSIHRLDVGRDTLMRLVVEGCGLALTSESATTITIPGITFRDIGTDQDAIAVIAVWSPFNRSAPLRHFLDLLPRNVQAERHDFRHSAGEPM